MRGEIWTVAGGPGYAGKPRPAVILQDDDFDSLESVTFCPFTTDAVGAALFRLVVEPIRTNGLRERSWLMVDKITTVQRAKLGLKTGRLDDYDMARLNEAVIIFLGLAG